MIGVCLFYNCATIQIYPFSSNSITTSAAMVMNDACTKFYILLCLVSCMLLSNLLTDFVQFLTSIVIVLHIVFQ